MSQDIIETTNVGPTVGPIGAIRNWTYDWIVSNTPSFYRFVLENQIRPNSRILEVGIGNGSCIVQNKDLIVRKNLKIVGIDIDDDYVALCLGRIQDAELSSRVTVQNQDLLTFVDDSKFDYILFSESYPVIPTSTMCRMMDHCRLLLTDAGPRSGPNEGLPSEGIPSEGIPSEGQVVFIHNLESEYSPFRGFVKPLLRYVPGVWVDFGKLTTHQDFDQFIEHVNYKITQKILIECVTLSSMIGSWIPDIFDFKMEQYAIVTAPYRHPVATC